MSVALSSSCSMPVPSPAMVPDVGPTTNGSQFKFDEIDVALAAFARGDFLVVMDDENRENEGDLICAANLCSTEKMAWMIKHTSGYVCISLPPARLRELDIPMMVPENQERHRTAYTVTVDYKHGTTTGISAHDRALTARKLAHYPSSVPINGHDGTHTQPPCPTSFTRPGHMVPLRASPGGVLTRKGHTEAGLDLCRLTSLPPAALLCELVNDNDSGSMARRDDCRAFADRWGLKMISIEQLPEAMNSMEILDFISPAVRRQIETSKKYCTLVPYVLGNSRGKVTICEVDSTKMGSTSQTLQESLESEYPLLDPSLLAAFISDLPSNADLSHEPLQALRRTLEQLSLDARDECDTPDLSQVQAYSTLGSDELPDSESSASGTTDRISPSVSVVSSTSTRATSTVSYELALDFLHILFPHLPIDVITQTLHEYSSPQDPPDEPDLSVVVDHLLNLEYIQDLAERGLEKENGDEAGEWCSVTPRTKYKTAGRKPKSRAYTYTIPLVDTLQRQRAPPKPNTDPDSPSLFSPDPWMRLNSLATRLSELLQPNPPGFFLSYFHAPPTEIPNGKARWKGEGDALREALFVIAARSTTSIEDDIVEAIVGVVNHPEAQNVVQSDPEQRMRLVADARLCVTATQGDSAIAIDLVLLLRELDDAFARGEGVAHAVRIAAHSSGTHAAASAWPAKHTHSPTFTSPSDPPRAPSALPQMQDRGWTVVGPRRPTKKLTNPHADFIPAYTNLNPRTKRPDKGSGNLFSKGGKGDAGERQHSAAWYRAQANEKQAQRNEALHEATRHWKNGNAKNHTGEVAMYYAEKAQELREQQKQWALDAARRMVEEKRTLNAEIDLHGLTVAEASVIVTEVLTATSEWPVKIITGRGRHSAGHVGVLGPAILEMLRSDGWQVKAGEGALIVRGRV